jgi:hypothetical protein
MARALCSLVHLGCITALAVQGSFAGIMTQSASRFSQLDQFTGHYVLISGQGENLKQAIDRATETMNFFVRAIARRQLRQKTVLYASFAMWRSGEFFCSSLPGEPVLSLPLSGSTALWKAPDGETVRVHLMLGPQLSEVFEAKQGRRENHFTISSDRAILTMDVRITSDKLPKPVEYRLIYRRV